jgi:signal transduction histidine kinase
LDFDVSFLIAIAASFGYLVLVGIGWRYRESVSPQIVNWLFAALGMAFLTGIAGIFPTDTHFFNQKHLSQPALAIYAASLTLVFYACLSMLYLQYLWGVRFWLGLGTVWWIVLLILSLTDKNAPLSNETWFQDLAENASPAGLVVILGWLVIGGLLLTSTFRSFYTARLPELANQALFWGVVMPLLLVGVVLSASAVEFLREMGWVIQFVALAGVTYGVITLRVVDIRQTLRTATINMALILVTAVAILLTLLVADQLRPEANVSREVLLMGLALAAAALHAPAYLVAENLANRFFKQQMDNVTQEISRFAQAIAGVVELNELTEVVMRMLRDVPRIRRSSLLLVKTGEQNTLRIEPLAGGMGEIPAVTGWIRIDGPIYNRLYKEVKPLLQYDLDFSREYAEAHPAEREFFRQLQMTAYAPIVVQSKLIGILACGPKASDAPFSEGDLELLGTIANQTGIALRNARLVDDLRKREQDQADTNKRLDAARRQLEALDAVKTDFITIASHELRTPLAQIRGHTDIIEALNDQAILDQDQLRGLTTNLRKAADRLETLIGNMLDVSQLDLSAMDLRFVQTTIENIVRLAIEPLQESIRSRKQSLTARGLRNLPPLEADMQRLVQAIRNVVLNAVKFTPDGGRIEVIGSLVKNQQTDQDEIQLIIKDTGIGIDAKNHEAIFEKFFRVGDPGLHSTGDTKFMGAGPGLGLTIARGVVTGHGGRIWVESDGTNPEKLNGSTFYIVLPLKPPAGQRHVMSFGTHRARAYSDTTPKPPWKKEEPSVVAASPAPAQQPVAQPPVESQEEEEVFEETNPTILNPSASRLGVAAAAIAAAQQALDEINAPETDEEKPELPPD